MAEYHNQSSGLQPSKRLGNVLAPQYATVAQLSWAPTTQTTTVTTTKTTTTSFPPFLLNAPKRLAERNPELYPLAATPTPAAVRRLTFDLGGNVAVFEEAPDATSAINSLAQHYSTLKSNNGVVQTITRTTSTIPQPPPAQFRIPDQAASLRPIRANQAQATASDDAVDRLATRYSHGIHKRNKRPRVGPSPMSRNPVQTHAQNRSDANNVWDLETLPNYVRDPCATKHAMSLSESSESSEDAFYDLESKDDSSKVDPDCGKSRLASGSATPPLVPADYEAMRGVTRMTEGGRMRSAVPTLLNTSPYQDGSLPSPSLSPITTAANLSQRSHPLPVPRSTHNNVFDMPNEARHTDVRPRHSMTPSTTPQEVAAVETTNHSPTGAFPEISGMLDSFDTMPESLKSYMMYQFLRRCDKKTLLFVADVVNPALKCDFLMRLPLELSWNILQHLDHKSMCRAAQVSKKWRSVVDSNEQAWAQLLHDDGYHLSAGELATAIGRGWGWQLPYADTKALEADSESDYESYSDSTSSWSSPVVPGPHISDAHELMPSIELANFPHLTAALKRKGEFSPPPTTPKRQRRRGSDACLTPPAEWFAAPQGPRSYANAAALAVSSPKIGLPSLRGNMHLFKSIYQKHHLIRHSWMDPKTKPLHLAFRGHEVHVVTCLQFDSEIILTGSDDSNIDIYSTRSGKSLMRLEGHDGGVWALEYVGNLLVSGSTDRSVRVWNMATGKCLQVFQGHTSTVRCLQILQPVQIGTAQDGTPIMMPKEPLIITGSRDSTCRVWKMPKQDDVSIIQTAPPVLETDNPYYVRTLNGHHGSVRAIAAHADTLVSGSYDLTVRVWKISTGEVVHRLQGHSNKVYSVVLDYDRKRCISGSMDNYVKIWSLETGACLYNLDGHSSLVGLLDLKDDYLVSAAADATLRIWEPETGRCKHVLSAHTGAITCFAHDRQKVISGSDQSLKMWNTKTGEWVRDLLSNLSGVWQIKFDERRCVAAVHRNNWTYIEVLDFGAQYDGYRDAERGRRIVVDCHGREINDESSVGGDEP